DEDESNRRRTRPASAKGPRKQQVTVDTKKDTEAKPVPLTSTDKTSTEKFTEERPMTRPGTARAATSRKPMKTNASDEITGGSGR
ncbi:unnamed protein product, partial [Didymodactylos carnosus]